jgi:cellulose synthase/poly-beta-1,6-N-acetylglucosamine synthase-like glycosyltransferase
MIDILIHLQATLLVPVGIFLLYLAFLTILSLFTKQRTSFESESLKSFAVIIPAHNEELVLAKTIQSALALDYPRRNYSVIVVADNCTDQTAAIAKAAGAEVHERFDQKLRGKGYALRWIFDKLVQKSSCDAVVVVDADSAMSQNFLKVMNYYLNKGSVSFQSTDIVDTGPASWSASMIRISFLLFNYIRPLGRHVLGLPMGLRGNGMCLSMDTLKAVPWNAFSLAEDVDYGLQLLLKDIPTYFAPEAIAYATMPQQTKNAESQRSRWEGGRFSLIRTYSFPLLKTAWNRKSYMYLDTLIDLITPSIVNMIALMGVMVILNGILSIAGNSKAYIYISLWLFAGFCGVIHLFLGLYIARADKTLYKALFNIPRYLLWKIGLYLHIFKSEKQGEWIRTTREIIEPPNNHIT